MFNSDEVIIIEDDDSSSDEQEPFHEIHKYIPRTSLTGYHPKLGTIDGVIVPLPKKVKFGPTIRNKLITNDFKKELKQNWKEKKELGFSDVRLISVPFQMCIVDNFLESNDIVDYIRHDFDEIEWNRRNMDLYEFFQSKDLKTIELEHLKSFYEFMKTSMMPWVSEVMGYDLIEISATCSCYTNTDYLLVHDDQQDDRMVAFVYYVTGSKGWNTEYGGYLQLISKDDTGLPAQIFKNILPRNNRLVLFPVTNDSYHQVSEVTTIEECRLTINGWFHARKAPIFQIPNFDYDDNSLFGKNRIEPQNTEISLECWLNHKYTSKESGLLSKIQKHIEKSSEISLHNFFKLEALNEVMNCLKTVRHDLWKRKAPSNRSCYEVLETNSTLPFNLERFISLLQSETFFSYLKTITDLNLKTMRFELQKWTRGSYCLLANYDWNNTHELDVIVYFPCGDVDGIIGGRTQYVNIEEEIQEALITIEPSENTLNIVYRDTARFTKYFSKQSTCKIFYLLICTYTE